MKKILLSISSFAIFFFADAQQLKTPAASPLQTLKQEFGLSSVELSYSRPAVKSRTIFGDLVPYGKVWRTGANAATTITFGDAVNFGGKDVPAGKYGLLTIPNAYEWTVILTKQLDVTSPAAYKQDQDVARIKVTPTDIPFALESFLITFDNILASSMNMIIGWDRTAVIIPITTDINTKINAQINSLDGKDNFPYFAAASFYLENGKDLNKALSWFNKATEKDPQAFWIWYQRAICLSKLGKKKEAIVSANKSIELATKAKSDDYIALNNKLISSLN